jgi:hypothetical protein
VSVQCSAVQCSGAVQWLVPFFGCPAGAAATDQGTLWRLCTALHCTAQYGSWTAGTAEEEGGGFEFLLLLTYIYSQQFQATDNPELILFQTTLLTNLPE